MWLRKSNSIIAGLLLFGLCIVVMRQVTGSMMGSAQAEQGQETQKVVVPIFQDAFMHSQAGEGVGDAQLLAGQPCCSDYYSAFFQFTDPPIASDVVVVGAKLRLFCFGSPADENQGLFVLRTLSDIWSERALRRDNRPHSIDPSIDWEITCDETKLHNDHESPELTEMVRQMVAGEVENYGWELRSKRGADTPRFSFHSKETGAADSPLGKQPLLEIEYQLGPDLGPSPTQTQAQGTAEVTPTLTPGATISATPSSTVTNTATEVADPSESPTPTSAAPEVSHQVYLPLTLLNDRLQPDPVERLDANWDYWLATDDVSDIAIDPVSDTVWASGGGIAILDGNSWTTHEDDENLLVSAITMKRGEDGSIWVGSNPGARRWLPEGGWEIFPAETGLDMRSVRGVDLGPDGSAFFVSGEKGVSILRP